MQLAFEFKYTVATGVDALSPEYGDIPIGFTPSSGPGAYCVYYLAMKEE